MTVVRQAAATPLDWRVARWVRLGLLATLVVFGALVATMGMRAASLADLESAIAAGEVDEVRLVGELPGGATGSSTVRLMWQDGLFTRITEVVETVGTGSEASPTSSSDAVDGQVRDMLRAFDRSGGLRLVVEERYDYGGTTWAGWWLPSKVAIVAMGVWLVTVALLITGPEPRRATRWAWAWALLSPLAVVAVPLFLLVSGRWRGGQAASPGGRRLTGGWAFLLVYLLSSTNG